MAESVETVDAMCEQLIKAVNVMMDAESNQIYRLEALKFCEEFKEKCTFCVPCGLKLAEKSQTPVVRHFGLQILEHVIKYRWNNMSQKEKVQLKNCAMALLTEGVLPILEEHSHIKDVLSRIVVEMIKREWPQNWPDMLKEMELLTGQGEAQTELVMMILLRLAEDVITFQTLPSQRRRDIQQTLTKNMDSIFRFLLTILQHNMDEYRQLRTSGEELQAKGRCRVAVATLNTLAGYIDWVAVVHITKDNMRLLEVLCLLLSEADLQLEAVECLLIIVSRKGKLDDRKPLMVLFDDVAMHYILSAAQSADGAAISCNQSPMQPEERVGVVERHYTFLKRLCQVLCALGTQLCALVGHDDVEMDIPANLSKYTEAFLSFTTHPSQFLKSSTQMTWGTIFRHEILSKDPVIIETTIKYLRATMTNLVKTGFPSKNDNPACEYSRVDFDSDEDFNSFFNSFRAHQGEVLRSACRIVPLEAFQISAEWLQYQINAPLEMGVVPKSAEGLCSIFSPSVVQWDAMTFFTESVMGQLFKNVADEKLPIDQGIELLQAVLNYDTRDPLILSCLLTNISSLFPFVTHRPQLLPQVLYKLLGSITFEMLDETHKSLRTRAVKNVRRHACNSIIKICRDYPQCILPCFDMFYDHVKKLFSDEALLTQMEKCALMEALILISNQFKDYNKQMAFLDELLAPVVARWTSVEMTCALSDPAAFLTFIGADNLMNDPGIEETACINRTQLSFCMHTMLAVVKRARWPTDLEEAKAGGFVVGNTDAGAPVYRNPSTAKILAVLPNLLALMRTHNQCFMPENVARLSETFSRVHEVMDVEKMVLLGLHPPLMDIYDSPPVYKSNLERMQGFLGNLYDNCFHILGNVGLSLQQDFYTIPGLAEQIVGSAFVALDHVPDWRLRPVTRVLMKQLVLSCPPEYYDSLLCPLLGPLFTYMLQRLIIKWQIINQRSTVSDEEAEDEACEENQVTQEMLEEHLARLITKEVLDLLILSCITRKGLQVPNKEDVEEEEMMVVATEAGETCQNLESVTELGKCLLKHENVYMTLLNFSFTSLSWKDTSNCNRTAHQVCWTLLRQVVGSNLLPEAVTWFFTNVLKGLQMHGQHEMCNNALTGLGMLIYENLRPQYAELRLVMNEIPQIDMELLDLYDNRLLDPNAPKVSEKKRKDLFRKLIAGTVGKALGQQFKKEVHIRNLPSLFKKAKPEKKGVLEDNESTGLAALFSPQRDDI